MGVESKHRGNWGRGRPPHGPVRQLGSQTGICRATTNGRERPKDVCTTYGKDSLGIPLYWLRVHRELELLEDLGQLIWLGCLRHGCSGIQGEVECSDAGGIAECIQLIREQFLDGKHILS